MTTGFSPSTLTTTGTSNTSSGISTNKTQGLDIDTVTKASQAISGEIVLDKLLETLMELAITNAGAQIGYLILSHNSQLTIEAIRSSDGTMQLFPGELVRDCSTLPHGIINYVARTQENLVLSDASHEGRFISDPYIVKYQPLSILCASIVNQGKLIGILYLENNLTTNTFTPDRLKVLNVLSAQAAISLENAQLYRTLEQKVEERTAQLAQANQEISALNERLKAENLRMGAELDVTRRLQQMILPNEDELSAIPGLEIAGYMEPAEEVGGDYYDILHRNGRVKIGIGDVTGHGLESGMLMIMAQTAVRSLLENNEADSLNFLSALNRTLYKNVQRMKSDKNMTLALLDYHNGILKLSGQHEEVILIRANGEIEQIDTMDLGFPMGLDENIEDFISEILIQLNSGNGVVLYTDGITEAENLEGEQYGLERLCQLIQQHWSESVTRIKDIVIEDVRQHIGEQKMFDDITLVVLKQA